MVAVSTIQTRDEDTIEIVETFKTRKGIATYSEALEKLVQRAKDAGLHLADQPLIKNQPSQNPA